MAKHNAKGRSKLRAFSIIRHDMKKSEAYRLLSPADRAVWIEVLCRYNGRNNGEIPLSCREAQDLCGISKNTAARSFQSLIQHGFVKVGQESGFNVKTRLSRRWILTHESLNGRPPTNEWRDWQPPANSEHGPAKETHGPSNDTDIVVFRPKRSATVS